MFDFVVASMAMAISLDRSLDRNYTAKGYPVKTPHLSISHLFKRIFLSVGLRLILG